jgi:hypothetical protein
MSAEAEPHFDNWAFENHVTVHAVSQETHLDYRDMQRMSVVRHSTFRAGRYIPAFSMSDQSLRLVLASRMWTYVKGGRVRRVPERFLRNWKALRKLVDAKVKKLRRAGSHFPAPVSMEIQAAIAYRSWRLGENSPTIAAALHVSPFMVRTTLDRVRKTAEKIGLEIGFEHHSKGKRWNTKAKRTD